MSVELRTGPSIARHRSRQDYGTPPAFLASCVARFGALSFDLAATHENKLAEDCFTVNDAALEQPWHWLTGTLWLNPPYSNIAPWAKKCAECRDRSGWLLFLVPASVDSKWFREHVHDKAYVMPLEPRLAFVGEKDPYPKPLMLCAFGFGVSGFQPWRWKP